jgi:23S rRNA pseudouridine2605 synthase
LKKEERLQKIIAHAGVASRRHAEELITSGQVTVNGRVVTELGTRANPARDHIKVAGKLIHAVEKKVYVMLHKPVEVVATLSDPEGRRSLADLLHGISERVYPVGRLEYHAAGLVFLTNDGELANRMLRAHALRQTYLLKTKGPLTPGEMADVGRRAGARLRPHRGAPNPWYEVTLADARSDVLRESLAHMGHPVEKMKRVGLGGLELGRLLPGNHRELTAAEVAGLERASAKASKGKVRGSDSWERSGAKGGNNVMIRARRRDGRAAGARGKRPGLRSA